jgi:two-component system LytT family response regulator
MKKSRMVFETYNGPVFFELPDIIYCRAKDNWTYFYLRNKRIERICQTLKEVEEMIDCGHFLRVHRSYLVNLLFVKEITGSYELLKLVEEYTIPIARRRRRIFKNKFRTFLLEV